MDHALDPFVPLSACVALSEAHFGVYSRNRMPWIDSVGFLDVRQVKRKVFNIKKIFLLAKSTGSTVSSDTVETPLLSHVDKALESTVENILGTALGNEPDVLLSVFHIYLA